MEAQPEPFKTFEDLEVYKSARSFRKAMYSVSRKLPSFEKFELASQIRRASVSLTNNIAEGHGRWHFLDHIKFLLNSRGSLSELLDDLNVCEDEDYRQKAEIVALKAQGWELLKLINGYLRYLRNRKTEPSPALKEESIPYGDSDHDLEEWLASLPIQPS